MKTIKDVIGAMEACNMPISDQFTIMKYIARLDLHLVIDDDFMSWTSRNAGAVTRLTQPNKVTTEV